MAKKSIDEQINELTEVIKKSKTKQKILQKKKIEMEKRDREKRLLATALAVENALGFLPKNISGFKDFLSQHEEELKEILNKGDGSNEIFNNENWQQSEKIFSYRNKFLS